MLDREELERLRKRYKGAQDGSTFDPRFRRVVDRLFSGGTRSLPYSGAPTLLAAPYMPEAAESPDIGGLQVAMVGVPMDLGVSNRTGARFEAAGSAHHRAHRAVQLRARLPAGVRSASGGHWRRAVP